MSTSEIVEVDQLNQTEEVDAEEVGLLRGTSFYF